MTNTLKTLIVALIVVIFVTGFFEYAEMSLRKEQEQYAEDVHSLNVTQQKMQDWKLCIEAAQSNEYVCNAMIGYPQDLIRDFQIYRDRVNKYQGVIQ